MEKKYKRIVDRKPVARWENIGSWPWEMYPSEVKSECDKYDDEEIWDCILFPELEKSYHHEGGENPTNHIK